MYLTSKTNGTPVPSTLPEAPPSADSAPASSETPSRNAPQAPTHSAEFSCKWNVPLPHRSLFLCPCKSTPPMHKPDFSTMLPALHPLYMSRCNRSAYILSEHFPYQIRYFSFYLHIPLTCCVTLFRRMRVLLSFYVDLAHAHCVERCLVAFRRYPCTAGCIHDNRCLRQKCFQ